MVLIRYRTNSYLAGHVNALTGITSPSLLLRTSSLFAATGHTAQLSQQVEAQKWHTTLAGAIALPYHELDPWHRPPKIKAARYAAQRGSELDAHNQPTTPSMMYGPHG